MAEAKTKSKHGYRWLRILMGNLMLVVLGVGAYFLYFKSSRENALEDTYVRNLTRIAERIERFAENGRSIGTFLSCAPDAIAADRDGVSAGAIVQACEETWRSVSKAPGLSRGRLLFEVSTAASCEEVQGCEAAPCSSKPCVDEELSAAPELRASLRAADDPYIQAGWLFMPTGGVPKPDDDAHGAVEEASSTAEWQVILLGIAVPVQDVFNLPSPTFPFDAMYLMDSRGREISRTHILDRPPSSHPTELIEVTTARLGFPRMKDLNATIRRTAQESQARIPDFGQAIGAEPPILDAVAASFITSLSIGERSFRTFVQPLYTMHVTDQAERADDSGGQNGAGHGDLPILVGIVGEDRFNRTALAVGYVPLGLLLGAAVVLLATLPMARLFLGDRHVPISRWWALRLVTGSTIVLLMAGAMLTYWSQSQSDRREVLVALEGVTVELQQRLEERLRSLRGALLNYHAIAAGWAAGQPARCPADPASGMAVRYSGADAAPPSEMPGKDEQRCRCLQINNAVDAALGRFHGHTRLFMPFGFHLDLAGTEQVQYRMSCRDGASRKLSVPQRRYFDYWVDRDLSSPRLYVERIKSYLDGALSFVGSTRIGDQVLALDADIRYLQLQSATVDAPPGVRFVLMSTSGEVLFHTNDEVSVDENWIRETDAGSDLIGRILGGDHERFSAEYRGVPIVGYVVPVGGAAPDLRLIGYVPIGDLQALRFYSALVTAPIVLLTALACAVLFVIIAMVPGRRQELVFPSAHDLGTYAMVTAGGLFSLLMMLFYLMLLDRRCASSAACDLPEIGNTVMVLSVAMLLQVAWVAWQRGDVFAPEMHAPGRRYLRWSILLAATTALVETAISGRIGEAFLIAVTGGGGWIPAFVVGCRRWRASHGPGPTRWVAAQGVDRCYLSMWVVVLFSLVFYSSGTNFVVSDAWQKSSERIYRQEFQELTWGSTRDVVRTQVVRNDADGALRDAGRHYPWQTWQNSVSDLRNGVPLLPPAGADRADWAMRLTDSLPSVNPSVATVRYLLPADDVASEANRGSAALVPVWRLIASLLLLTLALAVIWLVVRATARRVFGLNTVFATHIDDSPFSTRAADDVIWVLYVESLRDQKRSLGAVEGFDCRHVYELADLESSRMVQTTVLILDGLEDDVVDPRKRSDLIGCIEMLQVRERVPGLIVSPVLPSYWLSRHEDAPEAEENLDLIETRRIAEVLERCRMATGAPHHPLLRVLEEDEAPEWDPQPLRDRGVPDRTIRFILDEVRRCPRTRRFLTGLDNELIHRMETDRIPGHQVDRQLVTQVLARAMEGEFLRFWSVSSPDEQRQLLVVADYGYPNFADLETVQSLMQRGLLAKNHGRLDITSEAFRHFLKTRPRTRLRQIQAARREGSVWDAALPSIIVMVALILAFLMVSGAQVAGIIAAGVAAVVAALPVLNGLVALLGRRSPDGG